MVLLFSLLTLFLFSNNQALAQSSLWKIKKTNWTTTDEKNYQDFIIRLGRKIESRFCTNMTSCMNSDANIYRQSDPTGLLYKADCADFP